MNEMKNFNIVATEKFSNPLNYQLVEDGIYNDLNDVDGFSTYRIAVTVTIEKETISPQILDKKLEPYFVYVEETLNTPKNKVCKYIIGGELEDLQKFKTIIK